MRTLRSALAVILITLSVAAAAESAKSLYKKALDADSRQDYETAYDLYKAAYDKEPKNLNYRVPYERTRFLAAASKVRRGQKLRELGKLQEALELFQRAAEIDPSNDLALQEIRRTRQMMQNQASPSSESQTPAPPRVPTAEDLLRQRVQRARGPVELEQLSDVPITVKMTDTDSKVVYETLGKLSTNGINVLFDADYQSQSKRITVDLQHVSLRDALDIVALESHTFWRPVTPNTIFVAQDTQQKRKDLEQTVIKTFYLGNGGGSTANTDLTDIVQAIRQMTEQQKIQHIPSQNAIIMKGTPDQIALAQKIIDDLDKAKPEVVVDIVVALVNRSKSRNYGIIPPQNASVTLQGTGTTTSGTGSTATTSASGLTFKNLEHLGEGNFSVTVDSVKAQLLLADADSRVLQSPRLRSTDNEKGSLRIATKIPIATGSFGTPLGVTGGASLGVNTQFTYLDVGVILEITPHVHPDGEVTLKISLEVSSNQGPSDPIGGISQPIIGLDKVEQTIRLRDGEANLLGGILEESESKTVSGTPILGSIPILKYFFSQTQKKKTSDELVFLMVPHIVRGQEFNDANRRPIDIGTQGNIEMRAEASRPARVENDQEASAPAVAPVRVTQQVAPQPGPTIGSNPAASGAGSDTLTFRLDPAQLTPAQGSNFTVNVSLANGRDVYAVPLQITYDPKVLQFVDVTNGDFLSKDGQAVPRPVHRNDATSGTLQVTAQRLPGASGVSGDGTVFKVVFLAKTKGSGVVSITIPGARNSQNQPIRALGSQAAVTVN